MNTQLTPHTFTSSFGQCECRWCGRRRHDSRECPVTLPMRRALVEFREQQRKAGNRAWKAELQRLWESSVDIGPELRQLRNVMGPSLLAKLSPSLLDRVAAQSVVTPVRVVDRPCERLFDVLDDLSARKVRVERFSDTSDLYLYYLRRGPLLVMVERRTGGFQTFLPAYDGLKIEEELKAVREWAANEAQGS